MWKSKNVNLGIVPQQVNQVVRFEYLGTEPITEISTSCGCSQAEFKDNILTVTFFPHPVPTHILREGRKEYTTTKYISLKEGSKHIQLSFTATIKSPL